MSIFGFCLIGMKWRNKARTGQLLRAKPVQCVHQAFAPIFAKGMGMEVEQAEATAEKVKTALAKLQAIPRSGVTDDIASAAVFLASDEAGFINGEDIVVDGGLIWGRRFSEVMRGGGTWSQLFE